MHVEMSQAKLEQAIIILDELIEDNLTSSGIEELIGNTALIIELSVDEYGELKSKYLVETKLGSR